MKLFVSSVAAFALTISLVGCGSPDAPKPGTPPTPSAMHGTPDAATTEAKPEGDAAAKPEGDAAAKPEGDAAAKPEGDAAAKPEGDAAAKPEGDAAAKTEEAKPEAKPEGDAK